MQHTVNLGQIVASDPAPYHLTGNTWSIPDLSASQSGYAFAQTPDSTPPTFVSSELDTATRVLTITFSEIIDATNVDAAKIHIRESGTYTGGITLTANELVTTTNASTISFTLTMPHLETVKGLTTPELTVEPGAVRDTSGNLIVGTFDVSTATFDDVVFSVSMQETTPTGMAFSNDGAKMFVVGDHGNDINEYTLSTPFDVSTADFVDSFSVSDEDTEPTGMAFSNDGAKMFVVGDHGNDINEYTLSTPFDVSTASYAGDAERFSVSEQDILPTGMAFSNDGLKMFVVGDYGNGINESTLSTPFDVSTATFANVVFSVSEQDLAPRGMAFSNDGLKMFIVGWYDEDINEYTLSTPFDVSTATFDDVVFSVSMQETAPTGMAFSNDGAKMFVIGDQGKAINEYTLSSVYPITVTSPPAGGAFVTTWRTTTADESITLPISGSDMTVDWGDGNTATGVSAPVDHTYNTAGDYTIQVTGGLERFHLNNAAYASKLVSLDQWGNTTWTTMESAFYDADNMAYNAADSPDLSTVTDMSGMFRGADSFNGDLSNWNVSKVTDMNRMFSGADAFDGDISSWSVSKVTDMESMFRGASDFNQPLNAWDVSSVTDMSNMFRIASSFNQTLNAWDVSSVTDMSNMFYYATSFDHPLNSWNVSSVNSMFRMFSGAESFNHPLNSWDVSSVTSMFRMFYLALDFNQPLNSWNVSRVTNMNDMFRGASDFNQPLNSWDVSKVTSMANMFLGTSSFTQNLGNWYVVQDTPVLTANATFSIRAQNSYLDGLVSTYSIDDTRFVMDDKTLSLNSTNLPPAGIYPLGITAPAVLREPNAGEEGHTRTLSVTVKGEHLPFITTWRTESADPSITINFVGSGMNISWGDDITETNLSGSQTHTYTEPGNHMVSVTGGLTGLTLDRPDSPGGFVPELASIDQWGGISWTNMSNAFAGASNMIYMATDTPDLSLVTDMSDMFVFASSFNGDLNSWDVSSVTDMSDMFVGATSFNGDLNSWDVSSVDNMARMFGSASSFDRPLNAWVVSSVTNMNEMFRSATSFNQTLNSWDVSKVTDMSSTFDGASSFNQPLNSWDVSKVTNMDDMFYFALAFSQNLGKWYVTLDPDTIADTGIPGVVGTISAQNQPLKNHSPTYVIVDGLDKNHFEIVTGNQLNMISSVSEKAEYSVNVTASGTNVFESGNNWRVLVVKVSVDINAPPVLNIIGDQTVNEFVELTFMATASDDDSLTFLLDGTFPLGAAITSAGVFTWTPTESQDGDHTITVQVTDGSLTDSETLTVTVNEVNVAPVLNAIGDQTVNEFVELTFMATASDTDVVDNLANTLTFLLDGTFPLGAAITSAGVFTWTPTESQVGSHDITVQVTDGSLTDSETLTVTVRDVNAPPVLNTIGDQTVNEFVELTFMATASDDDSLTFLLDGTFPLGAAITSAGVFTWTPTESQDGDHTITVQVTDGSLTDSETLTVTVNEVNVAPVLSAIGDKGTSKLVELTFMATASDTDVVDNLANTLTFLLDGTFPSGAAITSAGVFTWTPTESQVGSHDITVQVTDGSLTDSETLTVTVRDVNAPPVLNTIGDQTVNEFVELTFMATASDDDSLTFSFDGTFPLGAAITSAGVFTWTPTESQDGDHTITVQVTDGSLTDSETLTVTVNEVNVAPVLNTIGDKGTSELIELTFTATASDTDVVDNLANTLTFLLDGTFPSGAAITSAGVFTWTPTESQVGSHDITVQVTDGSLTDSETLTVTVKDTTAPDTTLPADAFITTWRTDSANQTITIPVGGSTARYSIDWGDNSPAETDITGDSTHTYREADSYTVSISGGLERFHLDGQQPNAGRLASIEQWGDTKWTTMNGAFDGAANMVYNATDSPDLGLVSDMSYMFAGAAAFDGDLSSWDVSSVTNMFDMFSGATSFDQPLNDWDVSSVTEMDGMFAIATSFNHPLNDWDVSSVTDMAEMFYSASDFNQPLNDWDVSSVTEMDGMFAFAYDFNGDLSSWDVSSVMEMDGMFYYASDFNQPLNDWDVSSVTDMAEMFYYASDFNQPLNDWDVSSVTDMAEMFYYATSFNQPLNSWNVSRVTNMDDMFYFATAFSQNLGNWYVVANATSIAWADVPGVVAEISAQNDHLNGHNPTYGISRDNDYAFFEIVNGNKINMTSVGTKSSYMVNVTASGSNVFEDGNNWRMLVVRVTGGNNADLGGLTISSGTLSPQFSSSVITYTASVDNSVTQVTVTPTASDSLAAITVNGNTVISGNDYIVTSLTVGEPTTVTVIVTAQDSTTKTYTITLTRAALSGNADLGGLTISSGTLSPQFSSSVITYTASVDNSATQVTVTPTASDSLAAITVNGNTVISGNGYIVTSLTVGEPTTVTVIVTAQDSTTKTYTITLTRAALSDNADLGGLTISSGTLSPQFSSSDITYTASVDNSATQVTVTPTASDSLAAITVNDNDVISGNDYIITSLTVGEPTTVTVIVTAQDSTTKTYTITLTRAALSDNADLGGLTISSGTLSPQFSSSVITYTASVDNSATQVTVTPTASDSLAAITVNGNDVISGNGYIVTSLTVGEPTTVTVIVTAQDSTTKTYTITLTRAALSDNADLGGLTISSGTLSPQFSSSDITYTASVDNSATQVTVTPTASDSLAAITVNDNIVISGNDYIITSLTVGEPTTVTVIVTAQDSTTKTYTITLTRAALSDNADLGGLTISSGTLSPQFSSSDITYTASVDNSATQVTVTPTASDSLAAITVNGNDVISGNDYIVTSLTVGEPTTVTVIVTAQDSTTKTYTITLTRAALSDNADLGGLTISSGTLSPQFSSSVITYTASVDNSATQVTVTPTASDSLAAITVNGNDVISGNDYIVTSLTVGEPNTVTVIVTAQDSTTKTYTITLTRAALSDNADLGGLTISSGTLSPQFSSSVITYTASVDNSATQVTVTPTASDSLAAITVNGNDVISGNDYIVTSLTVGEPNTVTVIVTAQDSTTKTYTITLTRAALSDNADLGGLTISSGTLSPQFSSSVITYTASVDNSATQVTVTPTASDSLAAITVNGNDVISGNDYIVTSLTVGEPNTVTVIVTAQDSTTKTYIITVTVRDVPITVSSAAYNPGNGQLTITFNQDIATVDYSGLHVRSSANPDTGGITLSSVTGADYSGRTITATLDSEQQDQYDALQSPHLVVEDGAVTDTDGDRTTDVPPQPIRDASQKGSSSSSSSKASIVHINALAQSRLVDIPPHIAEQVESHDASDPLEPITPDGTFDLPLVINGYGYLLDAYENTLIPQTVTAGDNPVHITFTVYTEKEFAHFILYLNLQGRNTNYADSDTYITYKDDGTTSITDPHGYIGSATVTVTQEDDQIPEKRTVRITIEFEEPMGSTNMVAYMWNTDREALFVKIIDALEVVAASPESAMQAADPEPLEPDSVLPADPEPVTPDFADDAADPEPVPYDILGPDDYDDTQILQIIRMWSGFESESITDEQLLELLGLDDHQGADIPDWMMTELGVLVAKGTVTVDEFLVALQYVLEHD